MQDIAKFVSIWALMHTIQALYKTGVFSLLEQNPGGLSVESVSDTCQLKFAETAVALEFLSILLPEVMIRQSKNVYALSESYQSFYFQSTLHFSLAYLPVIGQIDQLMTGKLEYGRDINRDAGELALSSEQFITNIVKDLIFLLEKETFEILVDLGCGSGYLVKSATSQIGCQGIGIDKQSVAQFQKSLGPTDPIFIKGDISRPELWASQLPEGQKIFVASMVLHEFLYESKEALTTFFTSYRSLFSGSIMYIIEYSGLSYDELVNLPDELRHISSVYQFIHPLSKQGLPKNKNQWRIFFAENGLANFVEYDTWNNSLIYKVYL